MAQGKCAHNPIACPMCHYTAACNTSLPTTSSVHTALAAQQPSHARRKACHTAEPHESHRITPLSSTRHRKTTHRGRKMLLVQLSALLLLCRQSIRAPADSLSLKSSTGTTAAGKLAHQLHNMCRHSRLWSPPAEQRPGSTCISGPPRQPAGCCSMPSLNRTPA